MSNEVGEMLLAVFGVPGGMLALLVLMTAIEPSHDRGARSRESTKG
jgi:hypothetical protein